jgi:deazaflavin-dependent oxidoreductase (nitroreductase family)
MVTANGTSRKVTEPTTGEPIPKAAAPGPATAEQASAAPIAAAWGEGLAYPEWIEGRLPAMHGGFNALNRYVSVPALKMGLGRYMSNPLTGYLMILRTRGRKSGEMRDAPLGYTIVGDGVYCVAGFGRPTHWFQNVLADPHVEVILPGRAFSGLAEEVTDGDERRRVLAPLLRSMGVVAGMVGMGNPWRDGPEEIERKCAGMPLVRVRATGIAVGPEDPSGRYWVVPLLVSAIGLAWILRGCRRSRAKN